MNPLRKWTLNGLSSERFSGKRVKGALKVHYATFLRAVNKQVLDVRNSSLQELT